MSYDMSYDNVCESGSRIVKSGFLVINIEMGNRIKFIVAIQGHAFICQWIGWNIGMPLLIIIDR